MARKSEKKGSGISDQGPASDVAPVSAVQSTIDNRKSAMPCIGWFDRDEPWPEGSVIVFDNGFDVRLTDVDLECECITITQSDGGKHTYDIDQWNEEQAVDVAEVRFPSADSVPSVAAAPAVSALTPDPCPLPPSAFGPLPAGRVSDVDLGKIDVVANVRQAFDAPALLSLGESMQATGQLDPIKLLRLPSGRFRLLDGERRYRAALSAGTETLEARVYEGTLTDAQVLLLQLETAGQRADLSHDEWAAGLADAQFDGLSDEALGRRVGKSGDFVHKHRALARCHACLRSAVTDGRLSLNKALLLQRLPFNDGADGDDPNPMVDMLTRAIEQDLSEKQLTAEVNAIVNPALPGLGTAGLGTAEQGTGSGEAPAPAATVPPTLPTLPTDNAWKVKPVKFMGMPKAVSDALEAAGLWCAGLVAQFQARHGVNWTREITGVGEAAAAEVDRAMERLWLPAGGPEDRKTNGPDTDGGTKGTDEFDQTNQRRAAKVAEAPITGTKGQTQAERDRQAKADSDAASRMERSPVVEAKFTGTTKDLSVTFNDATGGMEIGNSQITVVIAGQKFVVYGVIKAHLGSPLAKRMHKAATAAAKKAKRK